MPPYRYAVLDCSGVGWLLVMMGVAGIVDVVRGDSPEQLLSATKLRYPGAALIADDGEHHEWVASIARRFAQPGNACERPSGFSSPGGPVAAV
jgi:hypothetical protein